jgi:hypothetical protein
MSSCSMRHAGAERLSGTTLPLGRRGVDRRGPWRGSRCSAPAPAARHDGVRQLLVGIGAGRCALPAGHRQPPGHLAGPPRPASAAQRPPPAREAGARRTTRGWQSRVIPAATIGSTPHWGAPEPAQPRSGGQANPIQPPLYAGAGLVEMGDLSPGGLLADGLGGPALADQLSDALGQQSTNPWHGAWRWEQVLACPVASARMSLRRSTPESRLPRPCRNRPARLFLNVQQCGRLRITQGTAQLLPQHGFGCWASTRPVPGRAASLLPGLPGAATRTGVAPAGALNKSELRPEWHPNRAGPRRIGPRPQSCAAVRPVAQLRSGGATPLR